MAVDHTVPDPSLVVDLLTGMRRSKIMFAAVSLGVFDALDEAPQTVDELALRMQANHAALERLLDACVGLQLLQRDGAIYQNTPVAATYLTRRSPRRMTGYINYSNAVAWTLWAHLEDAIRQGSHRWQQAYGWDGPIFSSFFKDDLAMREFLMGMNGFGRITSPLIVSAFDLSGFHTFVDIGGATGHLTIAACERYPHLKGILFDLPEALPLARELISQTGVENRIELVGGDFFASDLPEGDLFALGRILHDWSEEKCLKLLRRIHDRLPAGGGLLIGEKMLWDDKTGPDWAQMQDLNMLVCAEGRERTLAEYESLLQRAGFRDVAGARTTMPLDAILCRK